MLCCVIVELLSAPDSSFGVYAQQSEGWSSSLTRASYEGKETADSSLTRSNIKWNNVQEEQEIADSSLTRSNSKWNNVQGVKDSAD